LESLEVDGLDPVELGDRWHAAQVLRASVAALSASEARLREPPQSRTAGAFFAAGFSTRTVARSRSRRAASCLSSSHARATCRSSVRRFPTDRLIVNAPPRRVGERQAPPC